MRRIKSVVCMLLIAAMVIGTFSGCSGKSSGGDGESKQGKTLRFLDVSPSPERQAYFEGVFEKFEKETGNKVEYESVPWDDAANKVTVLGSAKELPDVLVTTEAWLPQLTEAGWLTSLDDYVDEHEDEYVELCTNVNWRSQRENYGGVYTVPDGFNVKGIFYRKDWVEEINYEIPTGNDWTYDAYFDLIAALTDEGQHRYGNSYRGSRGGFDPILVYMQTFFGGYCYDEEGNSIVNTPEGIEAFKKWCDIYKKGYAAEDSVNWGFVEMVDNFTGGLTGTLLNDSEVSASCFANMEDDEWGVLPMPVSEDGSRINSCGFGYGYSVPSQGENQEEALALVDFLAQPENNIEYCKMGGFIPVKKEVADDPLYGEDGPYAAFVEQVNDPNMIVATGYGAFNSTDMQQDMLFTEMQKYLLDQQSAEDACNHIGDELTKRMKQYLEDNPGSTVEQPKKISESQ